MIDLTELEQYFPELNKPINIGSYTFTITLNQDKETFVLNLKIKQKDTKENHLIKFRFGLGKDKETESIAHETNKPHFEIDIYKRQKDAFSATLYFTFDKASDEELINYAKGTVTIISKIIDLFVKNHKLDKKIIEKLMYKEEIKKELSKYEPMLINALYDCYNKSQLVVRQGGEIITIKTKHNLSKYLNIEDLKPLYLSLVRKIK
jgi:hypothetical protein